MLTTMTYYHLNIHSEALEAYITPTEDEPQNNKWAGSFIQTVDSFQQSRFKIYWGTSIASAYDLKIIVDSVYHKYQVLNDTTQSCKMKKERKNEVNSPHSSYQQIIKRISSPLPDELKKSLTFIQIFHCQFKDNIDFQASGLTVLPNDLIKECLTFLPIKDLCALAKTCKKMYVNSQQLRLNVYRCHQQEKIKFITYLEKASPLFQQKSTISIYELTNHLIYYFKKLKNEEESDLTPYLDLFLQMIYKLCQPSFKHLVDFTPDKKRTNNR